MEFPVPVAIIRRYPFCYPTCVGGWVTPSLTRTTAARSDGPIPPARTPPHSMANRNLIHQIDISDLEATLEGDLEGDFEKEIANWLGKDNTVYETNKIVEGRVRDIRGEDVLIDIGYKSEGVVKIDEWKEEGVDPPAYPKVGDTVQVLLETVEDENGVISLSYRKAKRQTE